VVADEVQRLAERATAATKQIETLVKTIQADTQEAITSMERSTTNVVAGAKSAEEAGQALAKIETSSTQLSQLIHQISGDAGRQSASATQIAEVMQSIRARRLADFGVRFRKPRRAVGEMNTLSQTAARVRGRLQAARGRAAGCVAGARSARRAAAGLLPQAAAATILSGLASAPRTPPLPSTGAYLILSLTRERIP